MSKYSKLLGEILDSIYEGYTLDEKTKKLKVVNESKANRAAESVHTLVLEKARELWDQLEASEESLADVADEITFEELNTDPSSLDLDVSGGTSSGNKNSKNDGEDLSSMLGEAGDFDLDSIFDSMDHLDDEDGDMPYNEALGDEEDDVVDGDERFSDLEMDSDNGYGPEDEEGEEGEEEFGGEFGDKGLDDEFGDEGEGLGDGYDDGEGMDDELGGEDNGFDFDLDLDPEEELEEEPEEEEEGLEGLDTEFGDDEGVDLEGGEEDPLGDEEGLSDEEPYEDDFEEGRGRY